MELFFTNTATVVTVENVDNIISTDNVGTVVTVDNIINADNVDRISTKLTMYIGIF